MHTYPKVRGVGAHRRHINLGDYKGGEEEEGHEWRSDWGDSAGHFLSEGAGDGRV